MTIEHAHALPAGTVLEGYRIERLLGEGGFGLTYYAIEEAIDRPVAIKEYLPLGIGARDHQSLAVMPVSEERGTDFEWGLERFRKEAATLVRFEHPNIVAIHRFFEALGTAYLVMQYIEGVSLEQIIKRSGHVPEAELRVIVDPLLDGLEQVHQADYVHRDIKPANIVLRPDGTPVLIDFGAARRFRHSHTVPLTSILTEGFAPLEQYQPDSEQGPWTDVYALGAVLYMCVTGQRPLSATSRVEARALDQPDPLEPAASACVGQYSQSLLNAIDAALALSREERPQTVGALRAILNGDESAAEAPKTSKAGAVPIGPDGKPLTPVAIHPGGDTRAEPTFRAGQADRVLPPGGARTAEADTLALNGRGAPARRSRPRWAIAAGVLVIAGLVGGIAYAGLQYYGAGFAAGDRTAAAEADLPDGLAEARKALDAAKAALEQGDYGGVDAAIAKARTHARAALKAKPDSQDAKVLVAEVAGFEKALASARAQHVATLLDNAAKAIESNRWKEAEGLLDDAERAGAAEAEVARLRSRLEEARASGGRLKRPPANREAPVPELAAAEKRVAQGWQTLRKGDYAGAVGAVRAAGKQIGRARAADAGKARIDAVAAKAGELRQAIARGLNQRITKLKQDADSAMQSGDVDGAKARLETAEKFRKLLAALQTAGAQPATR